MIGMDRDIMRAHLGMLLRALILGLSFTVVGLMTEGLPPLLLTAVRFAIAVIALFPLIWRASDWQPSLPGFGIYSILGLCQAAFFGSMFWAAHRISALSMAVLTVSVPFLAYCLGLVFRVEQPSARLLGILALGAAGAMGLAWAEGGGTLGELRLGTAEAVYFAGCFGLALYTVLSRWGLTRHWLSEHAGVRALWSLVIGAVLVGVLGLMQEDTKALAALTTSDALLLAYLGVLSTGGTFWLMQRATAVLTPAATTAFFYAPPLVSMLLLFAIEPQSISWRWLPGAVLVVLAIGLLLRRDANSELQSPKASPKHCRSSFTVAAHTPAVSESDVMVETPDGTADCYFVHPKSGTHPGVIVWPDALGLRPAFRTIGKRLAESGYSVLVINPYYRETAAPIGVDTDDFNAPAGREKVMSLSGAITPDMTMTDAVALAGYLDRQKLVDPERKLGTVGYCMGGAMAIRTAAAMADRIGAIASFHGGKLVTQEASSPHLLIPKTRASALIAIAENDDEKGPDAKTALREAFDKAKLPAEIEVYAGAMHGWCVPDTKTYDPVHAELAWSRLVQLFGKALA